MAKKQSKPAIRPKPSKPRPRKPKPRKVTEKSEPEKVKIGPLDPPPPGSGEATPDCDETQVP